MIDINALFTISYGLYIVSAGDKNKASGFISNTIFQVTAEPPRFAACCNKDNYTAELIRETGSFSVSVLHKDCPADIIGRFGYKSGRNTNKMEGLTLRYGQTGTPIVLNEALAYFECKVIQTIDVGSHLLFIADILLAESTDIQNDPLTYLSYRRDRKGVSPKNAPTYIDVSKYEKNDKLHSFKKYRCTGCGYVYDEAFGDPENGVKAGTLFNDIPDSWRCPACGCGKEDFEEIG